jgi:cell division protein FtsQ
LKAVEAEAYPQEALTDEEPKYLRRQKPLEIKRRKFGKRAWKTYLQVSLWSAAGLVGAFILYEGAHFLYAAPQMALLHPSQIEISGTQYVARDAVLEVFSPDRGRSVLRIPLDQRRHELESIAWVESVAVRRALPNRLEIDIAERTPVAFLRQGGELSLIDAHGVILPRPLQGAFHFPVVTGIDAHTPADERERRMQLFAGFTQQVEMARPGALDQVSVVDLSQGNDVVATIGGLQSAAPAAGNPSAGAADAPIKVHFGDADFAAKYRTLVDKIGEWRATVGRIESVDLRFNGEAVVNQDPSARAQSPAKAPAMVAQNTPPSKSPKRSAAVGRR